MARKSRKNITAAPVEASAAKAPVCRAGAYVRLSVKDNHQKGDSIENQTAILRRFIEQSPDIELHDFYIDNGISGMVFQRPQFERLLADAESGIINCIIVKDLSRLGRNAIDTGFYIEKRFPAMGVRFIAVNDDFDSNTMTDGTGGVMLHLKNIINEAYALEFSRKIRQQQNRAMLAGEYIGARPPFGYVKANDNCHKLVVDPVAAPIVRQIFEWAVAGVGLNGIALRLTEAGVLTPSHYKRQQGILKDDKMLGKGAWQTFTVCKILADEVYTGDMVQGKSVSVSRCQRPNAEENWIRVPDTHEAIVSRELFSAVREKLVQTAEESRARKVNPYTPNIYKGKVFCGVCGEPLHRQRSHRKKTEDIYVFHCLSNSRKARGSCVPFAMPELELSAALMDIIRTHAAVLMGKAIRIRGADNPLDAEKAKIAVDLAAARKEGARDGLMRKSLFENRATGVITSEEYREMRFSYEERERRCAEHAAALEQRLVELDKQAEEYVHLMEAAAMAESEGVTAELMDCIVDRIRIFPDRHIEVDFFFSTGFGLLREVLGDE
jgi:DNA invertase Pin-like site-specific DNA recombinase